MTWLTNAMGWMMDVIFDFTGDYGVAIVCITILVRMLMLPLNIRQRGQAKRQEAVKLQAEAIRQKYKNNKQKQEEELVKLYQAEGSGMAGCLTVFLQFPVMMCLYQSIRLIITPETTTVLLPWIDSLLQRDYMLILPLMTLLVQLLPQAYPYIKYFKDLNLQKMPPGMILLTLIMNSMFVFVIPAGVGLYYFISGVFSAAEMLLLAACRT